METHQLEAFSAVMSMGTVTGAGKLLNRSQPSVTRQIQELEADLGYALFLRNGPRVTPTHEAFLLYDEVERSLLGLKAIEQRARAIGQGKDRPVIIAATASLAASVIPAAFGRARAQAVEGDVSALPQIQVRTQSAEQIVNAILMHHADIGLVTLPIGHQGLEVHWIAEAPCIVALASDHPLADHAVIAVKDLSGHCIATVANKHRLRHRIDAALTSAGGPVEVCFESNHSLNALMAARNGGAVAIVDPASAIGHADNGLTIRPLDVHIPFLFGLVTAVGRPRKPAVDTLLNAIRHTALALLPHVVMHDASEHDALLLNATVRLR
jgi:DNA-binding transcriptional LysR family regulator